ncbi:MAG: hypothetical protein ACRDJH_15500 [Thermomicrobiales bacterium]
MRGRRGASVPASPFADSTLLTPDASLLESLSDILQPGALDAVIVSDFHSFARAGGTVTTLFRLPALL